jgi:hypothetical protein
MKASNSQDLIVYKILKLIGNLSPIYLINIYYKNVDILLKLFKLLYQDVLSQWKTIKYIKYV